MILKIKRSKRSPGQRRFLKEEEENEKCDEYNIYKILKQKVKNHLKNLPKEMARRKPASTKEMKMHLVTGRSSQKKGVLGSRKVLRMKTRRFPKVKERIPQRNNYLRASRKRVNKMIILIIISIIISISINTQNTEYEIFL